MFGLNLDGWNIIMLILALVTTISVFTAKNNYDEGTPEHLALRLYRVGMAFVFWSYGFGLFGLGLAVAAFVLSITVMIKGLVSEGVKLMIALFVVRGIGFLDTAMWLAKLQHPQ